MASIEAMPSFFAAGFSTDDFFTSAKRLQNGRVEFAKRPINIYFTVRLKKH